MKSIGKSFITLGVFLKIYAPINFLCFMAVLLYLNSGSFAFIVLPVYLTVFAAIVITLSSILFYAVGEILCSLYEIKQTLKHNGLEADL